MKQSSENQDFLPCAKTVLAMPYSPHCFIFHLAGHPYLLQRDPREASRHDRHSVRRDLRLFSSPPCQARLGQTQHLARELLPANFSLRLSTQAAAAAQPLWKAMGSTEVRAGRRCLQMARVATRCQLNINPWQAGGNHTEANPSPGDGARTNCSSPGDVLPDTSSARRTWFLPKGIIQAANSQ